MKPEDIRDWVEETLNNYKKVKLVSYTETPHKVTLILENPKYQIGYGCEWDVYDWSPTECS